MEKDGPKPGEIHVSQAQYKRSEKRIQPLSYSQVLLGRFFLIILGIFALATLFGSPRHTRDASDLEPLLRVPSSVFAPIPEKCRTNPEICIPKAPINPAKFAAFELLGEDEHSQTAYVFSYENLNVIPVHSEADIPTEDLSTIERIKPSTSGRSTAATKSSLSVSSVLSTNAGLSNRRPIVFYGDVRVTVGPLIHDVKLLSLLKVRNSNLERLEFVYTNAPRGPPPLWILTSAQPSSRDQRPDTRNVYVVGKVTEYSGPDQHDHSYFGGHVLDLPLCPSRAAQASYDLALDRWRDEVGRLYDVPKFVLVGRDIGEEEAKAELPRLKSEFKSPPPILIPRYDPVKDRDHPAEIEIP